MAIITPAYNLTVGEDYDPVLINAILSALTIGAIIGSEIASGTITGSNIAPATIEGSNIVANAIGASHIASNTISADDIQSDAITATHIQSGAVTTQKISVTSLDAISANLGEVVSGIITAATMRTSASPSVSRVIMDSDGLRGYNAALGITFKLPTDGSTPTFSSGVINNAVIQNSEFISNIYKTSSELPWVEMTSSGLSFRFQGAGSLYGTGVYDTATYGEGVAAWFGNSSKPVLSIEEGLSYADVRLYNRSVDPTGAAEVGDLMCKTGKLYICTTAGTPGTFTLVGSQT
jgi:hypothetical protein